MHRYLIIADDFTGANDTGLQFARRGIPTRVQIKNARAIDERYSLVVDTESRNTDGRHAQQLVEASLAALDLKDFSVIMKKIDSTLRGNIADELTVLRQRSGSEVVVVATAFPAMGRTCQGAVVHLNGKRLLETEVGRDPRKPIATDDLVTLFAPCDERIVPLSVETIREGTFPSLNRGIVICDATTSEDLDLVAAWALSLPTLPLFVGSAGLGEALVNCHDRPKPALAIVASLSEVSERQVVYAQNQGAVVVAIGVQEILEGKTLDPYITRTVALLGEGRDVILTVSSVLDKGEVALSGDSDGVGLRLMEALSRAGKAVIDQSDLSGVFLTGGDTAYGLLEALCIGEIEIVREVALGIPMMAAVDGAYHDLVIITKAGGFGKDDAISYALRALKEAR